MKHTLIYDVHETCQKLSIQFYRNAIRHYNQAQIDRQKDTHDDNV